MDRDDLMMMRGARERRTPLPFGRRVHGWRALRLRLGRWLAPRSRAAWSVTALLLVGTAVAMPQGLKQWAAAPSARVAAEQSIVRLPPAAFPELPAAVQQVLEREGCRLPRQEAGDDLRVIARGEFARAGQLDWAVICSRQSRSSIRVVWGGPASCEGVLATGEDSRFLKPLPSGDLEYARQIEVVRSPGAPADGPLDVLVDRAGAELRAEHACLNGRWTSLSPERRNEAGPHQP
jgi:hypothetical protein